MKFLYPILPFVPFFLFLCRISNNLYIGGNKTKKWIKSQDWWIVTLDLESRIRVITFFYLFFTRFFSFFFFLKLLSISICFFPSFSFCSSFICVLIIRQIDPATEQDQFNTLSSHGPCMALPCIYAMERGTWRIRREWFFFFFDLEK